MANEDMDILFAGSQTCAIYSSSAKTTEWIDSDLDFSKMNVPLSRHCLARISAPPLNLNV